LTSNGRQPALPPDDSSGGEFCFRRNVIDLGEGVARSLEGNLREEITEVELFDADEFNTHNFAVRIEVNRDDRPRRAMSPRLDHFAASEASVSISTVGAVRLPTTKTSVCLVFICFDPARNQPALLLLHFRDDRQPFVGGHAGKFINKSAMFAPPVTLYALGLAHHVLHLLQRQSTLVSASARVHGVVK
jgi:hypothetical protein